MEEPCFDVSALATLGWLGDSHPPSFGGIWQLVSD
jgi:hypothetical protein